MAALVVTMASSAETPCRRSYATATSCHRLSIQVVWVVWEFPFVWIIPSEGDDRNLSQIRASLRESDWHWTV